MPEKSKPIIDKKTKGDKNPSKYIDLNPTIDSKLLVGEDIEEQYLEEKIRVLSFVERLKRAQTMKRYSRKIELAKERAALRRASPEKIISKARKRALEIIRARISKNKAYSELSTSEKIAIDKRLQGIPQSVIDRIARKQIQVVKKADAERVHRNMNHTSTSASSTGHHTNEAFELRFGNDINAQFESFLESRENINEISMTTRKKPHNLYSKSGTVKFDGRFKLFKKKTPNISELFDLAESLESFEEGIQTDRVQSAIESERQADKIRHQRMLNSAKITDMRRKQILRREDVSAIDQIISRESKHKKLVGALKAYGDAVRDMKYEPTETKHNIAKDILDKYDVESFGHVNLVNLHDRIQRSKKYAKEYNVFDVSESNTPSDREWGTDKLTNIYKKQTPGQEDVTEAERPKGLWHNIRQRRSKGLRRLRPGEKGYPETLDIEKK